MTNADAALAILRGNGQPWLFVVHAVQIASSPDIVRDLIRYLVYGVVPPQPLPPRPPMSEWMAMYRGHRSLQDGIAAGMGLLAEQSASEGLNELRALSRMSPDEIAAEVAELSREEQADLLRPFIGIAFPPDDITLRAMLDGLDVEAMPDGPGGESIIDALLASPVGQFYFRVWWPCWVLYREYPQRLLRAARLGDLDALDRLLRLDRYALGDPKVARVVAEVMSSGPTNDRKRITNSLNGHPTVKLTDSNIRAGLAGLISQLALLFRSKVTAPEIQALFDAIERVRTGAPSDPKLTATGESWSKAVQRARTWPSLPDSRSSQ